jgi:hypothetical protein
MHFIYGFGAGVFVSVGAFVFFLHTAKGAAILSKVTSVFTK